MFDYSEAQLKNIEHFLSSQRLTPYLLLADNDKRKAIRLYERNTDLSEALYGILQGLEIALRNSIHHTMSANTGREDWFDAIAFAYPQTEQLSSAKKALTQQSKPLETGRIIAELSFGFWTSLLGPSYSNKIWFPLKLWMAFPAKSCGRKETYKRLDKIRLLRNRVAHHESILARNLRQDVLEITEVISWICPTTSEWVKETTHFNECFDRTYE